MSLQCLLDCLEPLGKGIGVAMVCWPSGDTVESSQGHWARCSGTPVSCAPGPHWVDYKPCDERQIPPGFGRRENLPEACPKAVMSRPGLGHWPQGAPGWPTGVHRGRGQMLARKHEEPTAP